jgi:hypothetical protein
VFNIWKRGTHSDDSGSDSDDADDADLDDDDDDDHVIEWRSRQQQRSLSMRGKAKMTREEAAKAMQLDTKRCCIKLEQCWRLKADPQQAARPKGPLMR